MEQGNLYIRALSLLVIGGLMGQAEAQVFIPSSYERDALNHLIPGIVDPAGIMDTLNPAIANLDTANFIIAPDPTDAVSVVGLKYLDSLKVLSIDVPGGMEAYVEINGWPDGLRSLFAIGLSPLYLNDLPAGLAFLDVTGQIPITVHITTMPDSLSRMQVMGATLDWQGPFQIGRFHYFPPSDQTTIPPHVTVQLPPSIIDSIYVQTSHTASVDLSLAEINNVFLFGYQYDQLHWPSGMTSLRISGDACLPWLPDSLTSLQIDEASISCIPNWPVALESCILWGSVADSSDVVFCSVLNTSCPGVGSGISGKMFIDLDGNGQYDPGEPPFPLASVLVQPNGYVAGCDSAGHWVVAVPPGSYTISPAATYPYISSIVPTEHTANLPNMGDVDTLNNFAITLVPGIEDLRVQLAAMPARPGFNNRLFLSCRNYGTTPMDVQLVLTYNAAQTWAGSSLPPTSQTGNTATWNLANMAVGSLQSLTVDLYTAATVPVGTPISYEVIALPDQNDETPLDNIAVIHTEVVSSFDPNDKVLTPSIMSPTEVQSGHEPIIYTVHFQNTGNYMASRVHLIDSLPDGLQVGTIEALAGSHAHHWYVDHDVLHVIFEDINLPDSTSDAANSQGFFRFSILPNDDLGPGTMIANRAHIFFDFNSPITTSPAIFHVENPTHVNKMTGASVQVRPNPVQDRLWVISPIPDSKLQYTIGDLHGRILIQGGLGKQGVLDVHELPAGVYTLTLVGPAGAWTCKFVKL